MTELAIITKRDGTRTATTEAAEARAATRAGVNFLHALEQGSVVEGEVKALAALRESGFRVKIIPDAHLIRIGENSINTLATDEDLIGDGDLALTNDELNEWQHHLIAFSGPNNPAWVAALENIGLDVVEPVSATAIFVVGEQSAIKAATDLPFVRWTGPMRPAYRLSADLFEREGVIRFLRIGVYPGETMDEVASEIEIRNGSIVRSKKADPAISGDYAELIAEVAANYLSELARVPHVRFIEYASPEPGFDGERETQIAAENLDAVAAPNTAPVVGYQAWLTSQGLSGAGTTIAICDSGVDANANNNTAVAHIDLSGRQSAFIDYTGGAVTTDTDGHGTHVAGIACGSAATGETEGAAPNNFLWGQGVAPAANYVTQNALFGPWPPASWGALTADAVSNGADVMNNSWWDLGGAGIGYTANSRSFDMLVRNPDTSSPGNQKLTIVFSAGNSGSSASTITSPKEAKNIIVVGNSLTFRPGTGDTDDIRGLSNLSSRGPAVDGRFMPHIVAPGTDVSSALSRTSARAPIGGTGSPDPMNPIQMIDQYLSISGTSMAAPHISGCCALIIEWWRNLTGGDGPSPAVLKALLVNGAEDVAGGPNASGGGTIQSIPNNDVGWGRVSLENILQQFPASDRGPRIILDQSHAFTSSGQGYHVRVAPVDTTRPMRVTLVWTDAPGAVSANPALVNDLDLEVEETSSADLYFGNVNFVDGFSQPTGPADVADAINNIECVYVQNPNGVYDIAVLAGNIQANARPPFDMTPWQDFALVIDNAELETGDPVSVVTVLDRSSSMITNGYVDITRASTNQFIDMMSVNDRVGVVSFGDAAVDEYAPGGTMDTITGQVTRDAAKNEVNLVTFSGCTFMGDGIERAGALLTPESNDKAIVLLSDGFDNKGCDQGNPAKPSALEAAMALPSDIPIHSCAMGPLSDQDLLEDLADTSGGRYYFMPTIFDLVEIYNFVRGTITGEGVAANESSMASFGAVKGCVESGAECATFTVGWFGSGLDYVGHDPRTRSEISIRLRAPNGKLIATDSSAVRRTVGDNHVALKVYEPAAGEWSIEVETARTEHTRFTAAIFVKSDLKLNLAIDAAKFVKGSPISFGVDVFKGAEPITRVTASSSITRPQASTNDLLDRFSTQLRQIDPDQTALADGLSKDVAKLVALQAQLASRGQPNLFVPAIDPVKITPRRALNLRTIRQPTLAQSNLLSSGFRDVDLIRAVAASTPAALESIALRPATANIGRVSTVDRAGIDAKLPQSLVVNPASSSFTGKFSRTAVAGSYNLTVTVSGIAPGSGSQFCRKAFASVLLRG